MRTAALAAVFCLLTAAGHAQVLPGLESLPAKDGQSFSKCLRESFAAAKRPEPMAVRFETSELFSIPFTIPMVFERARYQGTFCRGNVYVYGAANQKGKPEGCTDHTAGVTRGRPLQYVVLEAPQRLCTDTIPFSETTLVVGKMPADDDLRGLVAAVRAGKVGELFADNRSDPVQRTNAITLIEVNPRNDRDVRMLSTNASGGNQVLLLTKYRDQWSVQHAFDPQDVLVQWPVDLE